MSTLKNLVVTESIDGCIADYVVEKDTNENGWYIKYNSGFLIGGRGPCILSSPEVASAYGSLYQGIMYINLPYPLKDTASLLNCSVGTCRISSGASWGVYYGFGGDSTRLSFRVYDITKRSARDEITFSYSYMGYYK